MRYSYEFKRKCVEMYREGKWPDTPDGINQHNFHNMIKIWVELEDEHGPERLRHKSRNKVWTAEERYELVAKAIAGQSLRSLSIQAGINSGQLSQWVKKYKLYGYEGLKPKKQGRPPKDPVMKKKASPKPLSESEREELIRLRAENDYIKAEIATIKKSIALRREKWAAQAKARKQQRSKNFGKKDIS